MHNPALTRMTFLELFFYYFLNIVLDLSSTDFGTNLPPNLAPKSTKNRLKRVPNSKTTCIMFSMTFLIDLEASWVEFWKVLGLKLKAKLFENVYIYIYRCYGPTLPRFWSLPRKNLGSCPILSASQGEWSFPRKSLGSFPLLSAYVQHGLGKSSAPLSKQG